MNWSEMSKTFKLFYKKNFRKMDLRASKKKRQKCDKTAGAVNIEYGNIENGIIEFILTSKREHRI